MEKSIKCLKEEVSKLRGYAVIIDGEDGEWEPVTTVSVEDIYELINQLDKLEVLSQEFINEKAVEVYVDTEDAEVHVTFRMRDLQNLIVPKQEDMFNGEKPDEGEVYFAIGLGGAVEVNVARSIGEAIEILTEHDTNYSVSKKPVIPKFVAEWLEENHERNTMIELSHLNDSLSSQNMKKEHKLYFWIKENFDTFAEAWIAYPNVEVEEEQKYYVINNDHRMMLVRMMDGKTITEADPFKLEDMYEAEKKSHRLTEQEIKDYDPRYWAFRKPVEEMEE